MDIKRPEFWPTAEDGLLRLDLRERPNAERAVSGSLDQIYQLAEDMGDGIHRCCQDGDQEEQLLVNISVTCTARAAGIPRNFNLRQFAQNG